MKIRKRQPISLISLALSLTLFLVSFPLAGILPVHAEPEDGLILYYDFHLQNNGSTVISDASGSQNSGELKNANGKLDGTYSIEEVSIYGKDVHALHLSGGETGAYLQFPNGILYGHEAVTISAWVKLTTNNAYQRIWDFGTGQDKYIYTFYPMGAIQGSGDMPPPLPPMDGRMKRAYRRRKILPRTAGYLLPL